MAHACQHQTLKDAAAHHPNKSPAAATATNPSPGIATPKISASGNCPLPADTNLKGVADQSKAGRPADWPTGPLAALAEGS